jgi:hypothetical protein
MHNQLNAGQPVALTDGQATQMMHEAYDRLAPDVKALLATAAQPAVPDAESNSNVQKVHIPFDNCAQPAAPSQLQGGTYAECRECSECNHVGINDAADNEAACASCDWRGESPAEDACPGCGSLNVMSAACPKCGSRYSLLAEATLSCQKSPAAPIQSEREALNLAVIEHLGPAALSGGKMSVLDAFEIGWQARAALSQPAPAEYSELESAESPYCPHCGQMDGGTL